MTREEADEILSKLADAIAVVMAHTGVQFVAIASADRRLVSLEPGTRAWFAVIASGKLVEIVDGPFEHQYQARICAARHNQDGERGAHARLRYVPRVRTWAPTDPRRIM